MPEITRAAKRLVFFMTPTKKWLEKRAQAWYNTYKGRNMQGQLEVLKNLRTFMDTVVVTGQDAIDYAECIKYLDFWIYVCENNLTEDLVNYKEDLKTIRELDVI